ncbi:P-loop containing nucleoside triphosphate hydrolase protein, partial [Thamnocephalis sphaerospora]
VECCLRSRSTCRYEVARDAVRAFLQAHPELLQPHTELRDHATKDAFLDQHVASLATGEVEGGTDMAYPPDEIDLVVHVYQLSDDEGHETMGTDDADGHAVLFQQLALPARTIAGLWESLVYEENVKGRLMRYVTAAMHFSRLSVNANIITWNRVVLLHGPPGTGKTSLCRALAHKLAIRLSDRYTHSTLVEINSHSLFSKWFSESGKLVARAFEQINELASEEGAFLCILIDEVESLTAARRSALSGTEPSDAIRVVNAVLTQLDRIRQRPNVLLLTTSNITEAIDVAFVDRADIKQYIGPPSAPAIYQILASCVQELMRVGIIAPKTLLDWSVIQVMHDLEDAHSESRALYNTAQACQGLSGRILRKLPFLAHAGHAQASKLTSAAQCHALSTRRLLTSGIPTGASAYDARRILDRARPRSTR